MTSHMTGFALVLAFTLVLQIWAWRIVLELEADELAEPSPVNDPDLLLPR